MSLPPSPLPTGPAARARVIVECMGPHAATRVGLSLETDDDQGLGRWLVASILFAHRAVGARALEAHRALERDDLTDPARIVAASPLSLEAALQGAGVARADAPALVVHRACERLMSEYGGRLSKLAGQCDGLEELGGRLSQLASGFGRAGVTLFLQPLRSVWPAADELPLHAAAAAAAIHLGWLDAGAEPRAGSVRARLERDGPSPAFCDVEAALGALGRGSCRRAGPPRCALGPACPLHEER